MGKKLFIGNLSFHATQSGLAELFGRSGTVRSAEIPADRYSGKPKSFAFVEMATPTEAAACIRELNGLEFEGQPISVELAPAPVPKSRTGGNFRHF